MFHHVYTHFARSFSIAQLEETFIFAPIPCIISILRFLLYRTIIRRVKTTKIKVGYIYIRFVYIYIKRVRLRVRLDYDMSASAGITSLRCFMQQRVINIFVAETSFRWNGLSFLQSPYLSLSLSLLCVTYQTFIVSHCR